ncbi:hypothetical protein BO71DRAFT_443574 [Aspergillus ellipticus CBS 707.79]|uniref:Uncharacterized protein n=1 Tax=Aspergillus ellipticus CBS 707.79 TaxID=1448320 RepID=A0A319CZW9_9EURO|nr:hypothetical protein BO71DRAFT_443574 [Aspergillus ellipticus CBS 707.79]
MPYTLGSATRGRRESFDLASPESNPPDELAEAYRQIDDAGSLVDLDPEDDFNISLRDSRSRRSSSTSRFRGDDLFAVTDADFLNDVSDDPDAFRRKLVDHAEDEKRFRRATSSRSPVLSNAGTINPLTSENLQRRNYEEEEEAVEEEDDGGFKPSFKFPSTWGSKATHRGDWLKKMARRTELPLTTAEKPKEATPPKLKFETNLDTNPERSNVDSKVRYSRVPLSDAPNKLFFEQKPDKSIDGESIPNTPITVYKNSVFTKRSPTKRDSQDLLRKLSRTESPNQQNQLKTPEAQKVPDRRIYDKTPIVTGAWIDTPVTERINSFPEHLSRDIVPSPPRNDRFESSFVPAQPRIDEVPNTFELEETRQRDDQEKQKKQEAERQEEERKREEILMEERLREERLKEEKEREERQREAKEREEKQKKQKQDAEKQSQERERAKNEKKQVEPASGKTKAKDKPPLVKPDLPKSALETVLQDYKEHKGSLDVGDDTIESLQDIIDGQPGEPKTEEEDDAAYEKEILEKLELSSAGGKDTVDLDRLNEKLRSLAENIQKVKKGLDGLENQVSRDADALSAIPSPPRGKKGTNQHSCENCGGHNDRVYALISLPRLWNRNPITHRIRPTRLGWCSLILFVWYFSESTMCDFYCHPFISNTCTGNCLLPDAPRFPYTIPTMLWRWLHLSAIFTPLWAIFIAFSRLVAQLLGLWDGYVEEAPPPVNISGEIRIHGSRVASIPTAVATSRGFFSAPKMWPEKEQREVPDVVPELNLEVEDVPMGGQDSLRWEEGDFMDDDEFI